MGAFCCHGHQSFNPICLKTLCSLSPTPIMLHIKFDQDWSTGLRDLQVRKCKIFVIQGQVTPKLVIWSGPKSNSTELLCLSWLPATLMMIRSKMNELAWRQHFPFINLWDIFWRSRAANSVVSGQIWPKFELIRDVMHVLVTCKYKMDRIKNNREKVVNGSFLLPWTPEFWSNLPQNHMQPFPHPSDATHKIWSRFANWLQRYSRLKVWTTMTEDGPLVYYKFTSWAFGSGELKMNNNMCCQYIGRIWGHVTLSLSRWDFTPLRRHIRQLSIWWASTYRNMTRYWRLLRLN